MHQNSLLLTTISTSIQAELCKLKLLENSIKEKLQEFVPKGKTNQQMLESFHQRLHVLEQKLTKSTDNSLSRVERQCDGLYENITRGSSNQSVRTSQSTTKYDEVYIEPRSVRANPLHNISVKVSGNSCTKNIQTMLNCQTKVGCGSYATVFVNHTPILPLASNLPTYDGCGQPAMVNSSSDFRARTGTPLPTFATDYNMGRNIETNTFGTFHNMQGSNANFGASGDGAQSTSRGNLPNFPAFAYGYQSNSASSFQYYRSTYGSISSSYSFPNAAATTQLGNEHSSSEQLRASVSDNTASSAVPIGGATMGTRSHKRYRASSSTHNNNVPNDCAASTKAKPNKEFRNSSKTFNTAVVAAPTYDGSTSWFDYERQLEYIAGIHGWNTEEQLFALTTNLRGNALELYERVSSKAKPTFQQLRELLRVHFSGDAQAYYKRFRERVQGPQESLFNFALELNWLAITAFEGASKTVVEEIVKQQFIDGLNNKEMSEHLRALELKDVTEALLKARQLRYRYGVEECAEERTAEQQCQTEQLSDTQSCSNSLGVVSKVPSFFKKLFSYWENLFNEPSLSKFMDHFKNILEVTH